jgi:hypothetical protein
MSVKYIAVINHRETPHAAGQTFAGNDDLSALRDVIKSRAVGIGNPDAEILIYELKSAMKFDVQIVEVAVTPSTEEPTKP